MVKKKSNRFSFEFPSLPLHQDIHRLLDGLKLNQILVIAQTSEANNLCIRIVDHFSKFTLSQVFAPDPFESLKKQHSGGLGDLSFEDLASRLVEAVFKELFICLVLVFDCHLFVGNFNFDGVTFELDPVETGLCLLCTLLGFVLN